MRANWLVLNLLNPCQWRGVIDDHEFWGCRSKRVSLIVACGSCFDVSKTQDNVYDKIVWVTVGFYSHHIHNLMIQNSYKEKFG